jgi:hypothetical protein
MFNFPRSNVHHNGEILLKNKYFCSRCPPTVSILLLWSCPSTFTTIFRDYSSQQKQRSDIQSIQTLSIQHVKLFWIFYGNYRFFFQETSETTYPFKHRLSMCSRSNTISILSSVLGRRGYWCVAGTSRLHPEYRDSTFLQSVGNYL